MPLAHEGERVVEGADPYERTKTPRLWALFIFHYSFFNSQYSFTCCYPFDIQ